MLLQQKQKMTSSTWCWSWVTVLLHVPLCQGAVSSMTASRLESQYRKEEVSAKYRLCVNTETYILVGGCFCPVFNFW